MGSVTSISNEEGGKENRSKSGRAEQSNVERRRVEKRIEASADEHRHIGPTI